VAGATGDAANSNAPPNENDADPEMFAMDDDDGVGR
jgi:hypothetical protein